jgi:alkanesulfonate monooxygenase SsuD/methylene tetrahydromethanopterin reductase-like flavin-dependent oxidoreductase (luciferase family)
MDDPGVRVGVYAPQVGTALRDYVGVAQRAEDLGYDCLYTFDHFRPPAAGPEAACLESTVLVGAVVAATDHLRCGSLVLAVPYRHPAVVAATAAALDHASGGRYELGLGAGGGDDGNAQYGLPFPPVPERMAMLAEACEVIRRLWSCGSATFAGRHYRLAGAGLVPKPVQAAVPIIVGGAGERRLLRVAAAHADVWNTFASTPEGYAVKVEALAAHCRDVGRDPATLRRSLVFPAGSGPDDLRPYRDLGVGDFLLGLRPPHDHSELARVATDVAPALRGW